MRTWMIAGGVIVLVGCAAPSMLLINNEGKVQRCAAHGFGVLGTLNSYQIQDSCVADMKKLGYMELPEVLLGVEVKDWSASPLVVRQVKEHTPAQAVGIRPGDTLKEVDGQPLATFRDLLALLILKQPGDVLKVKFERDGRDFELNPVLVKR